MSDLVEFLRARLADDEQVARAASESGGPHWPNNSEARTPQMEHARRYDPARVLAEVDAKRRIITTIVDVAASTDGPDNVELSSIVADDLLRLLALPYDGHPHYQESWRP